MICLSMKNGDIVKVGLSSSIAAVQKIAFSPRELRQTLKLNAHV